MADSAMAAKRKDAEIPNAGHESKRRRWDAAPADESSAAKPFQGAAAGAAGAAAAAAAAAAGAAGAQDAGKPPPGKPGLVSLDALAKAKRALQMQKELNEKLKKLPQLHKAQGTTPGIPVAPPPPSLPPTAAAIAAAAAAAGLPVSAPLPVPVFPAGIPAGIPSMPGVIPGLLPGVLPGQLGQVAALGGGQGLGVPKAAARAPVLRLDAFGREIDEEGNVVERPKAGPVSTLKVNINKQKKEAFKILHPELEPDPEDSPFYDPRMLSSRKKLIRPRRASFQFVEEGKEAQKAEIMRIKAHFGEAAMKEAQARRAKEEAAAAEEADEGVNPNLVAVGVRGAEAEKRKDPIPDVEWWDAPLLSQPTSYTGDQAHGVEDGGAGDDTKIAKECIENIKESKITFYVEHPVPIEPPAEPPPPPPQPLRLTQKERKKLRTQKRVAREKERQEMVRQGLLEAPKAKVKMSNLMRVLASEATQDPTKMEKEVRAAQAEREQAHVDRNMARMLTPAEKREKKERKLFEDGLVGTGGELFVSVFKVGHLQHPQTRYKVDINAQENRLTGCAVLTDEFCLVIVEGGQKSIKRYTKLMMKRINWAAATKAGADEDADEDAGPVNWCQEVWQGSAAKAAFQRFTIEQCRNAAGARKFLQGKGVAHYWDAAQSFQVD